MVSHPVLNRKQFSLVVWTQRWDFWAVPFIKNLHIASKKKSPRQWQEDSNGQQTAIHYFISGISQDGHWALIHSANSRRWQN
jgi:hypothetical protein